MAWNGKSLQALAAYSQPLLVTALYAPVAVGAATATQAMTARVVAAVGGPADAQLLLQCVTVITWAHVAAAAASSGTGAQYLAVAFTVLPAAAMALRHLRRHTTAVVCLRVALLSSPTLLLRDVSATLLAVLTPLMGRSVSGASLSVPSRLGKGQLRLGSGLGWGLGWVVSFVVRWGFVGAVL